MAQQDVIDVPRLLLSAALGVLVTIAMVIAVQALYLFGQQNETDRKDLSAPPVKLTEVRATQRADLERMKVLTKRADGTPLKVEIPIERAMEYIVKEQTGR